MGTTSSVGISRGCARTGGSKSDDVASTCCNNLPAPCTPQLPSRWRRQCSRHISREHLRFTRTRLQPCAAHVALDCVVVGCADCPMAFDEKMRG